MAVEGGGEGGGVRPERPWEAEEGADVDGDNDISAHVTDHIGRDGHLETAVDEPVIAEGDGASPEGRADTGLDGGGYATVVEHKARAGGHVVGDDGEGDGELREREASVGAPELGGDRPYGRTEAKAAEEPVDIIREGKLESGPFHLGGVASGGIEGAD